MTGLVRLHPGQEAEPGSVEIADQVKDLVVHQFLLVAQSVGIDY